MNRFKITYSTGETEIINSIDLIFVEYNGDYEYFTINELYEKYEVDNNHFKAWFDGDIIDGVPQIYFIDTIERSTND